MPDLVEDRVTGSLAAPDDAEGLASAMCDLLADAERRRASATAGRKRVVPAFAADRLLADIDDRWYVELLEERASAADAAPAGRHGG